MAQQELINGDVSPDQKIYSDLSCHVASEAAFIAAVEAGIASLEDGPTTDHAALMAELHQIIYG